MPRELDLLENLPVKLSLSDRVGVPLSATWIVKVKVPGPWASVGVHENAPVVGWMVAPATWLNRMITIGLLPSQLREQYAMSWSARHDRIVARLTTMLRLLRRLLPGAIALWPDARR